MRRALSLAIDRDALVEGFWFGLASPSRGPVQSMLWAADRSLEPYPFRPDEARAIQADYRVIMDGLGPCARSRVPRR